MVVLTSQYAPEGMFGAYPGLPVGRYDPDDVRAIMHRQGKVARNGWADLEVAELDADEFSPSTKSL